MPSGCGVLMPRGVPMNRWILVFPVLVSFFGSAPLARADIIYPTNNGFEAPNLGSGVAAYGYGSLEAQATGLPALPAGGAWTFNGGTGIAANGSAFNVTGATNGNQDGTTSTAGQAAFIQDYANAPFHFNDNMISQTFGGFSDGFASVTFSLESRGTNVNPIDVRLDGQDLGIFTPLSGSSFNTVTTIFVPVTAGSHTLYFIGHNDLPGD